MKNKVYKARVTREVDMTKDEYFEHLKEKRDMYVRLINDRSKALELYSARCYEKIQEYEKEVTSITKQMLDLK